MYQFSYAEIVEDTAQDCRAREQRAFDRAISLLKAAKENGLRSRTIVERGWIKDRPFVRYADGSVEVETVTSPDREWGAAQGRPGEPAIHNSDEAAIPRPSQNRACALTIRLNHASLK